MKFCENCGAQLEDNHVFCIKCGTKCEDVAPAPQMNNAPPAPQPQNVAPALQPVNQAYAQATPKKSKAPVIISICSSVAVLGIVVGILFATGVIKIGGGEKITSNDVAAQNAANTQAADANQGNEAKPEKAVDVNESNNNQAAKPEKAVDASDVGNDQEEDPEVFGAKPEDAVEPDDNTPWQQKYEDSYVYPKGNVYKLDTKKLNKSDIKKILKLKELKGLDKYNKINLVIQTIYAYNDYEFVTNKAMARFFAARSWYSDYATESENSITFTKRELDNLKFLQKYRKKYQKGKSLIYWANKLDKFLDKMDVDG